MKAERIKEIADEVYEEQANFNKWLKDLTSLEHDHLISILTTAMQRAVEEETNNLTKDSGKVINLPKRIYLQVGYENMFGDDLDEQGRLNFQSLDHEFTTWCQDRIEDTDPCYIHSSEVESLRAEVERLKQCEAIVREIAEDDDFLVVTDTQDDARQWVRDNPK